MQDFISFRKFITPIVIQVIFWIGVAVITLALLIGGISSLGQAPLTGILTIFIGIPVALVFWRIYCELIIALFRALDHLRSIDAKTR